MTTDSEKKTTNGDDSYVASENFEQVRQKEFDHMKNRPDATGHGEKQLVALAISGGGIRSAVFALGFLQSLAVKGHLKKIDYLSTVSGGGYIGTALSWLLHRFWKETDSKKSIRYGTERAMFPFATSPRDTKRLRNESLINFMRRNRQYLLPGDGINAFSLLAVVFRGVILNALVYLPVIVAGFIVLQWLAGYIIPAVETNAYLTSLHTMIADTVLPEAAVWQAQIKIGLLLLDGVIVAVSIYLTITILYAIRTISSRSIDKATYSYRRRYDTVAGGLLLIAFGLSIVGSVPFVAAYLDSPMAGVGATGTGLLAGLLSFWKSQAKGLKLLPMPVLVWLGSTSLIYGILLISLLLCKQLTELDMLLVYSSVAAALSFALFLGLLVDLNAISLHRFYRDRLMETFMPDPLKVIGKATVQEQAVVADEAALSSICRYQKTPTGVDINAVAGALGPYHLINNNVILTRSQDKTLRSRGGDSFLLSPLYCGSKATGWRETSHFSGNRITLPSAMATSGAAVNPDTGVGGDGATRNPALSTFMRMLNLRLGYWVPNPNRLPDFFTRSYRPSLIFEGLIPRNRETANALELTDGGHFDNLAIYELVRRRVPFIILLDAAADPKFEFADFANLLEKIRADFGVVISDIELHKLVPNDDNPGKLPLAEAGVVSGEIVYNETEKGRLFYVKTTMVDGLPDDIYGYWRSHTEFPDEPTADQFFNEKQFEAYRELGYQLGARLDELPAFSVVKDLHTA